MTKGFLAALVLGTALLTLAACQSAGQEGTTSQSGEPAKADATFLNTAGASGIAEVKFAQLAATKATDPAVRSFADKMVADYAPVNQQLNDLAQGIGADLPSDMDARDQTLYAQLQSLDGRAFDRTYMDGQLQDLTMVIQAFQGAADGAKNPKVRSFAQQYLPMTQQHLQMALPLAAPGP